MIKTISKRITFSFAVMWVLFFCLYSSFLIGTLAHEIMHKSYAVNPIAIRVNYNFDGEMESMYFYQHSHEWVYLNGYVVAVMLMVVCLIAVGIIMFYKEGGN